jgi:hypothetical protein
MYFHILSNSPSATQLDSCTSADKADDTVGCAAHFRLKRKKGFFLFASKRKKMFFFALFACKRNNSKSENNESKTKRTKRKIAIPVKV